MLTILGGLAEFERELIKARTADGRKRAMDRGVQFGRKPKLKPLDNIEAIALYALRSCVNWPATQNWWAFSYSR
jgi:DNA invertase Pin-like site-specific DNA recombinase